MSPGDYQLRLQDPAGRAPGDGGRALAPSWLESVSRDDAGSNHGGSQAELALR